MQNTISKRCTRKRAALSTNSSRPNIELEDALHPRETEIIVNARKRVVKGDEVSFEEIVQIAFPGSHDTNTAFSMTFRHAACEPHAGELAPGGHVKVKNGTVFNVTKTVRS